MADGEFAYSHPNYPKVEKLNITNNIKNRIIFIFFIAVKIYIQKFFFFFWLYHLGLPLLDSKSYPSVSICVPP
jgi:hypothetical protein